jgi:hypothetical protein
MASITLEYVQKYYDPAAIFIATKNTNNYIVVYSVHEGEFVVYWLNLENEILPLTQPLNALEQSAFYLNWENSRNAYIENVGKDHMITFNEDFTECSTLIVGKQHNLSKVHIILEESSWFVPKVKHLVIVSKSICKEKNQFIEELLTVP